jgi:hypothetical protein
MTSKRAVRLLIVFAFAAAGANPASAEDRGVRGGGFRDGDIGGFHGGDFHGRGFRRQGPPVIVGGYLDGYGTAGGEGYVGSNGYGYGTGDWYGISPGHDDCPLFHKRVMTPNGWRIQAVPVC